MKQLFKCLVASLVVSLFLGIPSQAAVKGVTITSPTTDSSMTVTRSGKDVTKQINADVTVTGKSKKTLTYKSSDTSVATVNAKGKVTFKKAGKVTITVASKENPKKKDTIKFTVKQLATSVGAETKTGSEITKKTGVKIAKGKTLQIVPSFKPSDVSSKKVTYEVKNKKIATVDKKKGIIKGVKKGKTYITVKASDGSKKSFKFPVQVVSDSVKSITVKPSEVTLNVSGTAEEQSATVKADVAVTGSTANKNVVWASKDEEVATVTQKGKIKAVAAGTTDVTVTALDGTGKKATVKVTVIDYVAVTDIKLGQTAISLAVDSGVGAVSAKITAEVLPENATDKNITFTSSNPEVAAVSSDGTVTAKAGGTAVITVKAGDVTKTVNVTVDGTIPVTDVTLSQTSLTLATDVNFGYPVSGKLTASVAPANATNQSVTYASSDDTVAAVAGDGTVTAKKSGSAVITVKAGSITKTVKAVVVNGSKWVPDDNAEGSEDGVLNLRLECAADTIDTLNEFLTSLGTGVTSELVKGQDVSNGYRLQYNNSAKKLELLKNGVETDMAAKLSAGANLKNGAFGKMTQARFGQLHTALNSRLEDADFGNAVLSDGATTYRFTNMIFHGSDKSLTAVVNGKDEVKVKFHGTMESDTIYVSSTGELAGIEKLLRAVFSSSLTQQ